MHLHLIHANRRHQRQIGRGDDTPGSQHRRTGLHILAGFAGVGTGFYSGTKGNFTIPHGDIFLHHDRINPLGQRRPGEDADGMALGHHPRIARPGSRAAGGQRQNLIAAVKDISGKAIAIDRRIGLRWVGP